MRRSGKATGVEYVDRLTETTHAVYGKVVVLCASAIESVRILLNSNRAEHPSGVGGSSGHLGRYLCDHVTVALTGDVIEGDAEPAPSEDGFDFAATGLYIPSFCEKESNELSWRLRHSDRDWSAASRQGACSRSAKCSHDTANHVSLDPTVKDAWGIPVARIECSYSQDEINMVAHMRQRLPEIAAAGGLQVDTNLDLGRGNFVFRIASIAGFLRTTAPTGPAQAFTRAAARGWATNRRTRC